MNPREYMRGGPILVRGVPVYLNAADINIYFRMTFLDFEGLRERMVEGITTNPLYMKNSVEFAFDHHSYDYLDGKEISSQAV